MGALGDIPDRRGRKERQYGLPAVLTLVLAAMLSAANDLMMVFRWGRRLPPEALFLLGLDRAPCHAMYHDFFKALDVSAAEAVLGAWVRAAGDPGQDLGHVALDGKRLRGSAPDGHDGREGVHLVSVFASSLCGVIGIAGGARGQRDHRGPDPAQRSAVAGLCHHGRCDVLPTGDLSDIRDRQGEYLFSVKANQPELMADVALAFGDAFPPGVDQALKAVGAAHPPAPECKPAPT